MVKMPSYFSYDNDNIWKMSRIEDLSEMERPRQQGIVLHSIMSDIRRLDDVERAVKRKAMRGFIDYDDIPRYISILKDSLDDSRVRIWFDDCRRVIRERTVAVSRMKNGVAEKANYRPDRVVWTSVIDFNFGEEEPEKYFSQVRGYMRLLKKAYRSDRVRGFLWYPLKHKIIEIN